MSQPTFNQGQLPLAGQVWAITSKLITMSRAVAISRLQRLGATVRHCVTEDTTCLLAGNCPSSKRNKALDIGVPVMEEAGFHKLLRGFGVTFVDPANSFSMTGYQTEQHLEDMAPGCSLLGMVKLLALLGYQDIHDVPMRDQYRLARTWLIENVDLADQEDQKTQALKTIYTRSVCAQVLEWATFNRSLNELLQGQFNRSPLDLARELFIEHQWDSRSAKPVESVCNVVALKRAAFHPAIRPQGPVA